jgi:hypothetical protein
LARHVSRAGDVVGVLVLVHHVAVLGGVVAVCAVAVGRVAVGRSVVLCARVGVLHLGKEVRGGGGGLVHGHVELLLGEETIQRVGRRLELCVDGARLGLAERRAHAHLDVAARWPWRVVVILFKQLPLALGLVCGGQLFGLAKLVPCPSSLARRLGSAGAGGVANAKLVGVEEHGVAVGEVELLLLALQPAGPLLYARHEALADGGGEQLVLLLGDLDLVVVRVLDFVLGVLVLVLWRSVSSPQKGGCIVRRAWSGCSPVLPSHR